MTSRRHATTRSPLLYGLPWLPGRGCCASTRSAVRVIAVLLAALAGAPAGAARAQTGEWIWAKGNAVYGQTNVTGVYGKPGQALPPNTPPGRNSATTWTASDGGLWLFGGGSFNSAGHGEPLNDLWEFNPAKAEWTLVSGTPGSLAQPGTYGQLGVPSPTNSPGGRYGGAGWTDSSGKLWLFGGDGYDSNGNPGDLNDLWSFDPATTEWTWMGGTSTVPGPGTSQCAPPSYGSLGVSSATNQPGGRFLSGSWTDDSGIFWLFGGLGCDAGGAILLNDLWTYSVSSGQWTWVGGRNKASSSLGTAGVYGTLGIESASSFPGSRYASANWKDASGDLWLFGGDGTDATSQFGFLNDLWRFNPATRQWTWVSGSDTIGTDNCLFKATFSECARSGIYGTLGEYAPGNVPGGRTGSAGTASGDGSFLLFAGVNYAGVPNEMGFFFYENLLNDLWRFDPATGEWAWIGGSDVLRCGYESTKDICQVSGETGVYGTQGTSAATNYPGSRSGHASWADKTGNFWMFGGYGFDSQGFDPLLNDIWEYTLGASATPPPASTVALTSSANPVFTQNAITFTAHVSSGATGGSGVPTGTVMFIEGTPNNSVVFLLGSATLDASGNAALTVASLPVGTFTIEAGYGGDSNNLASSSIITELVGDFSLAANAPMSATVSSGGTAMFHVTLTPAGPISTFPAAIALTASGGPAGATYTFAPASIASGSAGANAMLTIALPAQAASANHPGRQWKTGFLFELAGLLLPFAGLPCGLLSFVRRGRLRGVERSTRRSKPVIFLLSMAALGAALALSGCGNRFYTGNAPGTPKPPTTPAAQSYTIKIEGYSGPLNHSATVTLVVN